MGRRPLAVAGERVLMPGPPGEGEAVELFRERAGRLGVTADDDPYVRELCGRLEGIPLAIEPAAGRLGALSPGQLLERLDDRFRLLTSGGRDALPRHRTLRTAIGWSHELCTPEERLLWSRLSVFAGRFDLEAAEYVCSGGGLHCDDVLDVLSALLARSVVAGCSTRAYGAEWLEATGDAVRLRRRDRDWYVGLATWCELDWFSPRQNEVAARVEAELPNLRGALEYCLGRHWLERSVELEPGHDHTRLKALWVLCHVAVLQGDTVPAPAALQEIGELNSNVLMGQVELAMAHAFLGDLPDAVRGCEEVRRVCEDHGERWARSYALYVLAYAAWSEGDAACARELLTDCLTCAHAFHDLLGSVLSIELLALVTVTGGDAAEAAVLQGAAASLWPSVGLPLFGSPRCPGPWAAHVRSTGCRRRGAPCVRHPRVTPGMQQPAASPTRKGGETAG